MKGAGAQRVINGSANDVSVVNREKWWGQQFTGLYVNYILKLCYSQI
ncbi:unnamed protein product [Brugia timori]|uniref:Lipoprotein n=1 Tax=Brugia timori TaxID=42155 RepID=A0A0R3Q8S0_9BILA|nr:unnamed protein product [Brugia timori]